ncbi:lipopolysaccharide biosynthesis protein [Pseudonocardia adelaidensis]|uniref:O-antigen/teichoic acid export membrane protein n=1 Tax=Pseudonocardia adelaidensis TaxID=648754 RepID=A0ABP9P3S9_9PSEU
MRSGLLGGWRTPQHRDGLALVLSSGLTSGLGLLFWIMAARLYDSATVGVNSTVLSAMTLLGTAAQLNLGNALLRFVPVAGRNTRALVVGCYAAAVAAATLAGAVFALGASWWAPELHAVFGGSELVAFFTFSTPVWAMFVMQDYVLPAIKKATLVPVENLVFSVLKIVFLGGAAALGMWIGLAVAWVAATAVIVLVVTVYLARVLPRADAAGVAPAVTARDVASFVRADYAGTVFLLAAVFGLPLAVLARLGPEAAAVYGIAWQIAYALYLVVNGMGQSLVAHVAADPHRLEAARRGMLHKAMALLVPAVLVIAVAAHPLLSLFGPHYADEGSLLLVLLVLSAIPNAITWSAVWAARVRRDGRVLFGLPAAVTTAVIAGSWFLMPVMGVAGTGVAWLGAQGVAAAGVLLVRAARGGGH